MNVSVAKNERGAWCVYLGGTFISDHTNHAAARTCARQLEAAQARHRLDNHEETT